MLEVLCPNQLYQNEKKKKKKNRSIIISLCWLGSFLYIYRSGDGPTVLIIKDAEGFIYGGYASQPWERQSDFYGDMKSFLFQLYPRACIFRPTGANNNLQWVRFYENLPWHLICSSIWDWIIYVILFSTNSLTIIVLLLLGFFYLYYRIV